MAAGTSGEGQDKEHVLVKIFNGNIVEDQAFAVFYTRNQHRWNPIAVLLLELEEWCSRMNIRRYVVGVMSGASHAYGHGLGCDRYLGVWSPARHLKNSARRPNCCLARAAPRVHPLIASTPSLCRRAYVDSSVLVPLALATIAKGTLPQPMDLMACIANVQELEEQLKLPGERLSAWRSTAASTPWQSAAVTTHIYPCAMCAFTELSSSPLPRNAMMSHSFPRLSPRRRVAFPEARGDGPGGHGDPEVVAGVLDEETHCCVASGGTGGADPVAPESSAAADQADHSGEGAEDGWVRQHRWMSHGRVDGGAGCHLVCMWHGMTACNAMHVYQCHVPHAPRLQEVRDRRDEAFSRIQARFRQQWPAIQSNAHVVVHLPSISLARKDLLDGVNHWETKQNMQIARLTDVMNELVDVIYVCPHNNVVDMDAYWSKLLQIGGVPNPGARFRIVVPENAEILPAHMSLTSKLIFSPKALARIKFFVGERPAYIVPGSMGKEEVDLAVALGYPILGPNPIKAMGLKAHSRRRKVLRTSQV